MVYKQGEYVLHKRDVTLRGNRKTTIYFFCKSGKKPKSGSPCDMPDGYKIGGINKRTSLPYLSKK